MGGALDAIACWRNRSSPTWWLCDDLTPPKSETERRRLQRNENLSVIIVLAAAMARVAECLLKMQRVEIIVTVSSCG